MLNFSVQTDRCGGCGLCVQDCPARIILQNGNRVPFIAPENEEKCVQCQHCLTVCPEGAISILGLNPDNSLSMASDNWPRLEQMNLLVRGRRSIRQYKKENVDPRLIGELLATVANAPTGRNCRSLTFTAIDDIVSLEWFRKSVMQGLLEAASAGKLPKQYSSLQRAIANYTEEPSDPIFRGAPHVLIVSASPEAPTAAEDVIIALSYFELLAQSARLGTVWCGLLKWALDAVPRLKSLVELPEGHPFYTMLFGYPAVQYARTVQRDNETTIKRAKVRT
jgi:NAD-dependent dihydropyrimidine dehydrogenase PreA subunit/nitroreductase